MHLSFLRELNGIANQIEDDLAQSGWITLDSFRYFRRKIAKQLQSFFFGSECQGLYGHFQEFAKIKINFLEFYFSGFDLRKIENVVNHNQEGIRRELYNLKVFLLFGGQVRRQR